MKRRSSIQFYASGTNGNYYSNWQTPAPVKLIGCIFAAYCNNSGAAPTDSSIEAEVYVGQATPGASTGATNAAENGWIAGIWQSAQKKADTENVFHGVNVYYPLNDRLVERNVPIVLVLRAGSGYTSYVRLYLHVEYV